MANEFFFFSLYVELCAIFMYNNINLQQSLKCTREDNEERKAILIEYVTIINIVDNIDQPHLCCKHRFLFLYAFFNMKEKKKETK